MNTVQALLFSIEGLTLGPAGGVPMVGRARVDQGAKHGKQDKPGCFRDCRVEGIRRLRVEGFRVQG